MKKFLLAAAVLLAFLLAVPYLFPAALVSANITWERWLAGLDHKVVQVGQDTVHYLEGGAGETIVLVHGFGGDKDNWTRFARYLTDGYHVIAPDLPGFGESTRDPARRYDVPSQVVRLRQFTQALGLGRFHIAGNSMGGQIAGFYAAEYPDALLSLGLLAPGGLKSGRPSELSKMLEAGKNPLLVDSVEDFDRLLDFLFVKRPYIPAPLKGYFARRAVEFRPFNDKVWKDLMSPWMQLEPVLPRIRAKTFVLWGDTDRILDPSGVDILGPALNPVIVILKDCGHAPMLERPKDTADPYRKFLLTVPDTAS